MASWTSIQIVLYIYIQCICTYMYMYMYICEWKQSQNLHNTHTQTNTQSWERAHTHTHTHSWPLAFHTHTHSHTPSHYKTSRRQDVSKLKRSRENTSKGTQPILHVRRFSHLKKGHLYLKGPWSYRRWPFNGTHLGYMYMKGCHYTCVSYHMHP